MHAGFGGRDAQLGIWIYLSRYRAWVLAADRIKQAWEGRLPVVSLMEILESPRPELI